MTDATKLEPAFPGQWDHGQGQIESWTGMTLRDCFAMKAMRVVSDDWQAEIEVGIFENFAHDCYSLADAMLAERAK